MKTRKALLRALALVLIFVMLMCPSVSLGTVYANTDEAVPESSSASEPLAEGIVSSGGNQAKALAEEAASASEDVVTTGNGDAAGPAEEIEPKDEVQSKSSGSEPVTDSVTDDVKDEGTEQPEEQSNDSDSGDSAAPALRAAAEEGDAEDSEVFTYTTSNSKITITGYTGTDPVVVIPAEMFR